MLNRLDESKLKSWIEDSLANNTHSLATGYQGKTLLYADGDEKFVIKAPHGRGLLKYLHTLMLRHEYKAYQQLNGFEAVPACYGLVDNTYLVLEHIDALPIRNNRPSDEEVFFKKMLNQVEQLHARNVAHMDLKKKDNLLVADGNQPYMIDFGAAVIRKQGFHPINHLWYRLAVRFDYNAWVKHKYHNRMDQIQGTDQAYHHRTLIEYVASRTKQLYTNLRTALARWI